MRELDTENLVYGSPQTGVLNDSIGVFYRAREIVIDALGPVLQDQHRAHVLTIGHESKDAVAAG